MYLTRTNDCLAAACDASARFIHRLVAGEAVSVRASKVRSLQWHRMYFATCRAIGENQDPPRDAGSIDMELRVLAGHYTVLPLHGHPVEVRMPKRIAFDKLTAEEWSALWPSLESAIVTRFGAEYVDRW